LIVFHKEQGTIATLTAVQPPGRFGAINLEQHKIVRFEEKPLTDRRMSSGWINGGFFVLSPRVLDYIEGDETVWERGPMESIAQEGKLSAYIHRGFWHAMDTLRDKNYLEEVWGSGQAPWKIWK
jgi:glucose-1-phosphate cytidylyltransferase